MCCVSGMLPTTLLVLEIQKVSKRCPLKGVVMRSRQKTISLICGLVLLLLLSALAGCASGLVPSDFSQRTSLPYKIPEAGKFGVIEAKSWAAQFPNQYRTFLDNNKNKWPEGKADLIADYPELVVLGKGYGYAKFFTEAGGHTYSLYTVMHNGRINAKTKAGCVACKSAQFNADAEQTGKKIYKEPFWPVVKRYTEGISCANCHPNEWPGKLKVTRSQWKTALGNDADKHSLSGEVCGQCHCDYSMDPKTGEPTSPYNGVRTMTPDQALKWYDAHNYVDWVYESTGAKMIAVRHSEYEYNYGGKGNYMTNHGYTCADCHMPIEVAQGGEAYTSHYWQSPLDNEELLKTDCNRCHKDLKTEVLAVQKDIDGRTHRIGERAADFVHNFEAALASGKLSSTEIERLRTIQRESIFFWNSAFAENSEGAHNPKMYTDVLDRAEKLLNEGDKILGKESSVANFEAWKKLQGDIFHSVIGTASAEPKN